MPDENTVELYLRIDGVEHGPLTVDDVKEWIDKGEFRRTDYIRTADKKAWVKAENLVHLKALFDEAREKRERGAFTNWLAAVREGRPPMELSQLGRAEEEKRIAEEQEALARERARFEEQEKALREHVEKTIGEREEDLKQLQAEREEERRRLAAERDEEVRRLAAEREEERARLITQYEKELKAAREEGEREVSRLSSERRRLDAERARLADEERELATMGKDIKRRRRLPLIVTLIVGVVGLTTVGIMSYFIITNYYRGKAIEEKLAKITALEEKIAGLTVQLEEALKTGDTAKAQEIAKEIEKARKEKEKLAEEVPEERMATSRGKAKLAGLLRAEGGGAEDPARSGGAVTSALSAGMGGVGSTYGRELGRNPGLEGHVIVSIKVAADGTVTNAHVVSSTIGNSAVESAVTAAARRARFAPAAGDTSLTYKFDFSP
jgi:TonB family protein